LLIDGIHIPLTTPFQRDGSLYLRKLEYNVGRYSLSPAAGLVALTGEGGGLSDQESHDSLRVIGESAAPEKVLIAAISKGSVLSALAVANDADKAGFDAVLLSAPWDWERLTPSELLLFFRAVADASPLPVFLHSGGTAPQLDLSVDSIAALAGHPNILGLFDAELTLDRYRDIALATNSVNHDVTVTTVFASVTARMQKSLGGGAYVSAAALASGTATALAPANPGLKTRSRTIGFQIMAARSALGLAELLEAGVAGAMPQLAACTPQCCYELYAAFKDGDPALAAEKQDRLIEAGRLMRKIGIAGVKYGCDLNGYFGGSVRLPRLPLDSSQRTEVERALSSLRN
jgi:4-hydroxy-2-oxoglutarate aldolase